MPTFLRSGPYRFYIYSHEPDEPAHIHVDRDACTAKYWLRPIRLAWSVGFRNHELTRIERMVRSHLGELLESWNEHLA